MPQVVAAAAAATGIASPAAVAAIQLGTSLLLTAASRALMPKPNVESGQVRGRQVSSRQPVSPREIVYGRSRKGGTIVFLHTSDNPNSENPKNGYLHIVIVVATHEVESIGNIYFDSELAIPEGSTGGTGDYENRASCTRRLGTAGQSAISSLVTASDGLWSSQHRLNGCAYIYVRLVYDRDVYPSGMPNITCDVFGKNDIYDPRYGIRRYSDNAALCLADYMSLVALGIGAEIGDEDGVNSDALIAAANVCDERVTEPDGTENRRYRCNGVVTLDQSPKTIIEAMMTAMSGQAAWQAGQWFIYAGAYRTPTLEFTSDDFAGDLSLQTRTSRQENFNGVRGQFIAPANDWQPDDFPAYQSSVYVAEDGGDENWDDISLPFTIYSGAAQRLAKIYLERKRRQQKVNVPGKLGMWRATVGENVNLTYSRFGFSSKPFEVQGVSLSIEGNVLTPSLVLQETSPLVYDHTASEFEIYEAAPQTTLPSAFDLEPPTGIAVEENLYQTRNSGGLKTEVTVYWEASTSASVAQYQVEASNDNGVTWQILGRTSNTSFDARDWQPGMWLWRVKAVSNLGVSSDYDTVSLEVFGLAAAPVDITNLTIQAAGGSAILKWDQHPDLDVQIGGRIVIRHSASLSPAWSNSVSMDIVAGAQAIAAVPLKPGSYLVRAEDGQGNVSDNPAIVDASGAQIVDVANITTLTADPVFTGTKTDVVANGGVLSLDSGSNIDDWLDFDAIANMDAEGGVLPSGIYDFATDIDLAMIKTVRIRSEIEMSINSLLTDIDSRPGDIDAWADFDGVDGSEVDVWVEVRVTDDDPAGSPNWGDWSRIDSSEIRCRGIEARAILQSNDPAFNPNITRLRVTADEAA